MCWYRATVVLTLGAPPFAALFALRRGVSRDAVISVLAVTGSLFLLATLVLFVLPTAYARHLESFCPRCRGVFVAPSQLKEARRGLCVRCGYLVPNTPANPSPG